MPSFKKVVIKASGSREIAHQETEMMPEKVCFAKTLDLVFKTECNDLSLNKLHLDQNNKDRMCSIYLLTGHSSPCQGKGAGGGRGPHPRHSKNCCLLWDVSSLLPGPEAVPWAGFLSCVITSVHLIAELGGGTELAA